MKNKVIVFLTVIVLIFTGATGVKADTPDIDDCINKTLEYEYKEAGVTDAQSFVNDGLMAVAGISPCEWWVINIKALYPETDFSEYVKAVENTLTRRRISSLQTMKELHLHFIYWEKR